LYGEEIAIETRLIYLFALDPSSALTLCCRNREGGSVACSPEEGRVMTFPASTELPSSRSFLGRLPWSGSAWVRCGLAVIALLAASTIAPMGALGQTPAPTPQAGQNRIVVKIRFDGDYLQVDEFLKRFAASLLRHDPPFLFLHLDAGRLAELRNVGYDAQVVDPGDFFQKVVRVDKPGEDVIARIRAIGADLIQREPDYIVLQATERQLDAMRRQQIDFRSIQESDLTPRFVQIAAPDRGSVALVVGAGIDIFEIREGTVIGRAFDSQIETLRRQGLKVDIAPPPSVRQP
jgi:hypothetical protein